MLRNISRQVSAPVTKGQQEKKHRETETPYFAFDPSFLKSRMCDHLKGVCNSGCPLGK